MSSYNLVPSNGALLTIALVLVAIGFGLAKLCSWIF
jgi:hypothetical protein